MCQCNTCTSHCHLQRVHLISKATASGTTWTAMWMHNVYQIVLPVQLQRSRGKVLLLCVLFSSLAEMIKISYVFPCLSRYLKDKLLPRMEDPIKYWLLHKAAYPYLYRVALQYLSTPASSVPCEIIFSKAGEIVSQRRSRLKPSTIKQILFLNKNL